VLTATNRPRLALVLFGIEPHRSS